MRTYVAGTLGLKVLMRKAPSVQGILRELRIPRNGPKPFHEAGGVLFLGRKFVFWSVYFLTNIKEVTMSKLRPLHDRVIVKRLDSEEKTKGGIIIPDSAKEKPQEGKIVAIGNGKVLDDGKKQPMNVKVGEKILFSKYSGSDIKIDGEDHLIMREDDILAVVVD
jgi:chaperonin GroES